MLCHQSAYSHNYRIVCIVQNIRGTKLLQIFNKPQIYKTTKICLLPCNQKVFSVNIHEVTNHESFDPRMFVYGIIQIALFSDVYIDMYICNSCMHN